MNLSEHQQQKYQRSFMPKRVFWPAALVVMGLIFMAASMGYLPAEFFNLWPLLLIIVGLGGLLTSDREEWMVDTTKKSTKVAAKPATKKMVAKKSKTKKK
jgi:hypothetical protein